MHTISYSRWAKLAVWNLLLVSIAGILLRYKGLFALPLFDYQFLLYGHSHFAFSGWISFALYISIAHQLRPEGPGRHYSWVFAANQLTALGMLISFPLGGYNTLSIILSTLNIFTGWVFAVTVLNHLGASGIPRLARPWLVMGLVSHIVSAAGPFSMGWLMAHHSGNQALLSGAVYYFLHMEYNGWFLFGAIGLFLSWAAGKLPALPGRRLKLAFWLMSIALLPAFLLSVLWAGLPGWIYWIAVVAAIMQMAGAWLTGLSILEKAWYFSRLPGRGLWGMALGAFLLKYLLQALSTIPVLGNMAFGNRPVLIGYLHLVMLILLSFFLLGFFTVEGWLPADAGKRKWIRLFAAGALMNEGVLMVQGLAHAAGYGFPAAAMGLFAAALFMGTGILGMALGSLENRQAWSGFHASRAGSGF